MPIYEYRCSSCGFEEEYLQKVGAALLTDCPECGEATFTKKLTAAGFQLKGSGWYATDFKNGGSKPKDTKSDSKPEAASETKSETKAETKTESKSETKSTEKPAASTSSSTDSSSSKA
jgi:putative FmdB family regulatory protein